jgi:hypothetical protein
MIVRLHRCRLTDPGKFDVLREVPTAGGPQHKDGRRFRRGEQRGHGDRGDATLGWLNNALDRVLTVT